MADHPDPQPVLEVTCPRCGRRTDRVQAFDVPVLAFLIVYIVFRHESVAGCPSCVRRRLWQLFWVNLLTANVLFPFVAPFILWDIQASHSRDRPGIPPAYHGWANLAPPPPTEPTPAPNKALRLLVVLGVLILMVSVAFIIVPRLTK